MSEGNDKKSKSVLIPKKNLKQEVVNLDKEFKILYGSLLQIVGKESNESCKGNEKSIIIDKLWNIIKSRFLQVCRKPIYSRGIQSILKWGSSDYRTKIFDKMKDNLVLLSMDGHSSRVVEKMYNYGDPEIRRTIREELFDKFEQIGYSKFGSRVFGHVFSEKKNTSESWEYIKNEILYKILNTKLAKFYNLGNDQKIKNRPFVSFFNELNQENAKKSILDNSVVIIQKFVDSELLDRHFVHLLIWNYIKCCVSYCTKMKLEDCNQDLSENNHQYLDLNHITEEGKTLFTSLLEQILEGAYNLLSTKEGVDSLIVLLGFAKAQQKKKLLKMIKKDINELSINPVDYSLILRLISITDDTKILNEIVWNSFIEDGKFKRKLLSDSYFIKLIFYLLLEKPNLRNFNQYEFWILNLKSFTTLKSSDIRRKEMNKVCIPALNDTIIHLENKETILECLIRDFNGKELILLLLNYFIEEGKTDKIYIEKSLTLTESISKLIQNKNEILKDNVGHRTIVSILKLINDQNAEVYIMFDYFRNAIIDIFQNSLKEMLKSKAVFILVEMIGQNLEQKNLKVCTIWRNRIKELVREVIYDCISELNENGNNTTGIQLILQYTDLKLPDSFKLKPKKDENIQISNKKQNKRSKFCTDLVSTNENRKKIHL